MFRIPTKMFLIGALGLLAGGCDPGGSDFVPPPTLGSIDGVVVDGLSTPIESANVLIDGQPITTSGTGGTFFISNVVSGARQLTLSRSGFDTTQLTINVTGGQVNRVQVSLERERLPVAYAMQGTILPGYGPTGAVFTLRMVITDADGNVLPSLSETDFTIGDFSDGTGSRFQFRRDAVVLRRPVLGSGSYSAMLLFDQSGSVRSTDPTDARLFAGKIFLSALGAQDEVRVAAFSTSGSLPFEPVTVYGNDYVADGPSFFGTVDDLASMEGGGTPLYDATTSSILDVSTNGARQTKAVIVFTDGDDTSSSGTIDDPINTAITQGVNIFTVGLSNSIDRQVLLEMASRTGGAFMEAADARQLVSYYGTLGDVLNGTATTYESMWFVSISGGSFRFQSGSMLSTSVRINTPDGVLFAPFAVRVH